MDGLKEDDVAASLKIALRGGSIGVDAQRLLREALLSGNAQVSLASAPSKRSNAPCLPFEQTLALGRPAVFSAASISESNRVVHVLLSI